MRTAVVGALGAALLMAGCASGRVATGSLPACPVRMAAEPRPDGEGVVDRLLPQPEAMALLSRTQRLVGRPIDGAYINNTRAIVRTGDGRLRTALVPYGMAVAIGDRVALQTASLSAPPLCTYVPQLITRKLPPGRE